MEERRNTLDVSSLYTNIPTEDGIDAALKALDHHRDSNPSQPPTEWLSRLLRLIYSNVFRFNDKFYVQYRVLP